MTRDQFTTALQVYAPLPNGGFNTGGLTNLTLNTNESAPQATANASITVTPTPPPQLITAELPWDESTRPSLAESPDTTYTTVQLSPVPTWASVSARAVTSSA